VASRRAAERAGFTVEGVLRDRIRARDGSRADAWIGSLLPADG
jgi:RimJ/RimL family protein N-acetyltransferase